MTPEAFEKVGVMEAKQVLEAKNWQMEIDLTIGNNASSQLAQGQFNIYFLRNAPDKSPDEYAKGASYNYDGFGLHIKENTLYAPRKVGAGKNNLPDKRKQH
mmetsp:Transcript_31113/g.23134  ORF Transcript_31113/g.23134 Transcript_31113/m.23134 type:complete len:101 (+) Transcript_31113:172-474(+)